MEHLEKKECNNACFNSDQMCYVLQLYKNPYNFLGVNKSGKTSRILGKEEHEWGRSC